MSKSPEAFRTISEVSDWLDTPAHVLRFWESKFSQIKPVKRAGGRRYYRPEDMALLAGIKRLLHEQGMTIKGVQKLLREQGARHVVAIGEGGDTGFMIDLVAQPAPPPVGTSPATDDDAATGDPFVQTAAAANPEPLPAPPAPPLPMHAGRPAHLPPLEINHPLPAERGPDGPEPAGIDPPSSAPAEAPPLTLPDLPSPAPAVPGILSRILTADPAGLPARRSGIAACRDRLSALRDRMAGDLT